MCCYIKESLTEERLCQMAEKQSSSNQGFKRIVNRYYRETNGKDNVDRAIRRVRKLEHCNGAVDGIEYIYVLANEITRVVNEKY